MVEIDQLLVYFARVDIRAKFYAISALIILGILKASIGIRVTEKEELEGLDRHEHGMKAYPDFGLNEH